MQVVADTTHARWPPKALDLALEIDDSLISGMVASAIFFNFFLEYGRRVK